jgi:hypothetical protein
MRDHRRDGICGCRGIAFVIAATMISTSIDTMAQSTDPLSRAIRAYEEGDLAKAEPLLRAAAADLQDGKQRARAWLTLALVHASRKDLAATRDSLRTALSDDPEVVLERDRVSPNIVAMFDALRGELRGELRIDGAGPTARVFVDGREVGLARDALRVPIGRRTVRVLSADRFRDFDAPNILLHAKVPARVSVTFRARQGRLRVLGPWAGAKVVNAVGLVGTVGAQPLSIAAGPQKLTFVHPSGRRDTRDVLVEPDGVSVILLPPLVAHRVPTAPSRWYARRRTWGFVALGVGAVSALAGGLLGKSAQNDADEIQSQRRQDTLSSVAYANLKESAENKARWANVMFGVSGAAALAGALLVLFDRPESASPPRTVRILPSAGGATLAIRF